MYYRLLFLLPTGIQKLILAGRVSEAIEQTQTLYPGLLDQNPDLLFKLKCRQFIEMVGGHDGEVKPSAHSPTRSAKSSPCASPSRTLSHSSLASAPSLTSSVTNGYESGELGHARRLDVVEEYVSNGIGNGIMDGEDMDIEDETPILSSSTGSMRIMNSPPRVIGN